jgi:hypothetical protein
MTHTGADYFASRIIQAGVSPIFVAQIMGHSNPSILQTYAKAIDEFKRSAIAKLEALRQHIQFNLLGRDRFSESKTKTPLPGEHKRDGQERRLIQLWATCVVVSSPQRPRWPKRMRY